MHLVILSGAARPQAKSNTAKIIAAFQKGYEGCGNTTEVWYLSDRGQWPDAAQAFAAHDHILIALPLYVENIPGILLEFLSGLEPKSTKGTTLAFLLQGGFPEASQSRCCEKFVETLPAQLGCAYGGTLIKGGMFMLSLMEEKSRQNLLAGFIEMGRYYAENGYFDKQAVRQFAGPEYMPEKEIRLFNRIGRPIQRIFMGLMAKKIGCRERLDTKPYADYCPERDALRHKANSDY